MKWLECIFITSAMCCSQVWLCFPADRSPKFKHKLEKDLHPNCFFSIQGVDKSYHRTQNQRWRTSTEWLQRSAPSQGVSLSSVSWKLLFPYMFSLDVLFAPYPSTTSEPTVWRASREIRKSSFFFSGALNSVIACGLVLCPYWPFWFYLMVGASTGVLGHCDSGFWGAVASLLWSLEPWHGTQTCLSVLTSISANPRRSLHLK